MSRFPVALLAGVAALALSLPAPAAAQGGPRHCPPGLARKDPPCVPPGQARGGERDRDRDRGGGYSEGYRDGYADGYRVAVGDLLEGDYRLIRNPPLFGLPAYGPEAWRYYLVRDLVVRADPETRRVLAIVGLVDALLD
jgi:hypothetical protein